MNAGLEGADRRAALTRDIIERTGLDEAAIEGFVRAFYAAARVDPLLGPKFDGVADWEAHVARIACFWNSVALMTGGYHGQPMQAHAHLGLTSAHFARWRALFEEVARECLGPAGADHMLDRARRIALSLEMGLIPLDLPERRAGQAAG